MLTLSGSKNPREGSEESWDGKLRGSGQNHRILLVPRGGWVPLVKALPSPPPRLLPSSSPKETFPNQRASAPSLGPLHDCLGSGDQPKFPPTSPTIAPDVAAGDGWAQGPAGSGHLVVLSLQNQHFLCQQSLASSLSTSSSPLSKGSRWGNAVSPQPPALSPSSAQSPSERSFLSCLPWAARDKEERGPSRPV